MSVPGAVQDPERVQAADIEVRSGDGFALPAYLARPTGEPGAHPGIVVIHDAFGLGDHHRDVARRFANAGFDAIVPDLYARTGRPDPNDPTSLTRAMMGLPDAQAVVDLDASAAHLRSLPGSNGRVGVIGFCSGGRHTLLFACSSDAPDAAVDCWGGNITEAAPGVERTPERPAPVVDLAENLRCPLLLIGGAEDQNPSPEVLRSLFSRLMAAGKDVTLEIFEGAGHAFFHDQRPNYRPQAAERMWGMVLEFFAHHLH